MSIVSLLICLFLFKQKRFEPDWPAIFLSDAERTDSTPLAAYSDNASEMSDNKFSNVYE